VRRGRGPRWPATLVLIVAVIFLVMLGYNIDSGLRVPLTKSRGSARFR
jgi:hypothetical protein